jgi:gas vesicle protein
MNVISRTLKFTLGLTLGAGVGAVAAMLLAPTSGKANRAQIKSRIDEILQAGHDAQHEREKELQEYWEKEVNVHYDGKEKDEHKK